MDLDELKIELSKKFEEHKNKCLLSMSNESSLDSVIDDMRLLPYLLSELADEQIIIANIYLQENDNAKQEEIEDLIKDYSLKFSSWYFSEK